MRRLLVLPLLLLALETAAQPDAATHRALDDAASFAARERLAEQPLGAIVQRLGERFRGTPYVAGMLDEADGEPLVISLTGFDCVTFVEHVLALAQMVQAGETDAGALARRVEALRYRDGARDGYCSRLHYFTDWIRDNDRRGTLADVTPRLSAAEPYGKRATFMTANRRLYPRLQPDGAFACIARTEADLAAHGFHFVPQQHIRAVYDQLEAGDVIAVTSTLDGLDVAHTGFVYKHADGRTGFLHASTSGRVVVEGDLQAYVEGNRRQHGILVARPLAR